MNYQAETLNIPWVESPFFEEILDRRNPTPAEREMALSYNKNGYVIFDLLGAEEISICDSIIEQIGPLYAGDRRVMDAWRRNDLVMRLACQPKVLSVLKFLYGRDAFPFQTLNFNIGTEQKTHSDTIHFNSIPARFMCGVWVALEDVGTDNGPLHYYQGSHKLPIYTAAEIGFSGASISPDVSYKKYYEPFVEKLMVAHSLPKRLGLLKKGQALIWAANLFHGGEPILRPGATRHSQVTHYYFKDTVNYTPLSSDSEIGRILYRAPANILNNAIEPARYLDRPFRLPLNRRFRAFIRERLKWTKAGSKTA
ncbi:MAG: phytanoyl-CoA dioxygenase family protein [Nevskia sp.]|nr:phytanoyl-CoA dioxygenase family protein [Nevskia sp.]